MLRSQLAQHFSTDLSRKTHKNAYKLTASSNGVSRSQVWRSLAHEAVSALGGFVMPFVVALSELLSGAWAAVTSLSRFVIFISSAAFWAISPASASLPALSLSSKQPLVLSGADPALWTTWLIEAEKTSLSQSYSSDSACWIRVALSFMSLATRRSAPIGL